MSWRRCADDCTTPWCADLVGGRCDRHAQLCGVFGYAESARKAAIEVAIVHDGRAKPIRIITILLCLQPSRRMLVSSSNITPTSRSLFLDPGPLRPLVEEFGRCLASQGHTILTVRGYEDAARHFAAWFQQTGTAVADIGEDTCVAFAAHRCRCPGGRRANRVSAKYARRAWRFVQFLSTSRAAGPTTTSEPTP